jgi:membrane associated rhomboid family serine protease
MFIPIRTNRPPRRPPLVTEVLILVNVAVYVAGLAAEVAGLFDREVLTNFGHLSRTDFHAWQLVTYQFLHDPSAMWHLLFNMLFLWVFGAAVEDRLGRLGYLAFYLMGGVISGLAHIALEASPVIGASGAIAGVTGGFLALFPRSRIQVFFLLVLGIIEIPALWFIGLYFAIDVFRQIGDLLGGGGSRVAYAAHIAGYLYGFGLAFLLLATQIVKREEYDVFFLFKQWRRRVAFRRASRPQVGGHFESASADTGKQLERLARRAPERTVDAKEIEARTRITHLLEAHDLPAAAAAYRTLLEAFPDAALAEARQLDIANQLHAEGDHAAAARAYELLLTRYPRCPQAPEIALILGVLYGRHLDDRTRGAACVERAKLRLYDPAQRALAEELLAEFTRE